MQRGAPVSESGGRVAVGGTGERRARRHHPGGSAPGHVAEGHLFAANARRIAQGQPAIPVPDRNDGPHDAVFHQSPVAVQFQVDPAGQSHGAGAGPTDAVPAPALDGTAAEEQVEGSGTGAHHRMDPALLGAPQPIPGGSQFGRRDDRSPLVPAGA